MMARRNPFLPRGETQGDSRPSKNHCMQMRNNNDGMSWRGKNVFVTGVCGTIGRQLLATICDLDVASIVGIDSNETELFFEREQMRNDPRVQLFLCDIRLADQISRRMSGSEIVLHAAAYKHVDMCERSPHEAILTNVLGTQNVISAAIENGVHRTIFTSSDKAVNPTSVMGTSKLMGERLMSAANAQTRDESQVFASIRFGNVLGSRGSVVPLFESQIAIGGPVTLTDRRMTRFIMSVQDAAKLVMDAVFLARGGEVIVTKMDVLRIEDLAAVMIEERAPAFGFDPQRIETVVIGSKPGEKMYEELTNAEEVRRTFDSGNYLVVKPAFSANGRNRFEDWERDAKEVENAYNSASSPAMNREAIRTLLRKTERV
jgi:FlaA1/EpsC-like NDP-sugar epimerase